MLASDRAAAFSRAGQVVHAHWSWPRQQQPIDRDSGLVNPRVEQCPSGRLAAKARLYELSKSSSSVAVHLSSKNVFRFSQRKSFSAALDGFESTRAGQVDVDLLEQAPRNRTRQLGNQQAGIPRCHRMKPQVIVPRHASGDQTSPGRQAKSHTMSPGRKAGSAIVSRLQFLRARSARRRIHQRAATVTRARRLGKDVDRRFQCGSSLDRSSSDLELSIQRRTDVSNDGAPRRDRQARPIWAEFRLNHHRRAAQPTIKIIVSIVVPHLLT